ncbi:hypothetical protein K504DRAFT_14421 [Pleomassaria siparia CBS 279.74]|uniref:Xylanolytic transcriptional activator regulatory domain-containing protein n=1 Tax=Pleomassaria siparia CBS 279.74 TaxID=1314801 RepID=A0A6G1KQT8_9PLEO|nr:hypothetical protein K504DRAFT_14421 [Pleomassaria siparia CBS 279.74]
MSSTKQVQDLLTQNSELKLEIARLQQRNQGTDIHGPSQPAPVPPRLPPPEIRNFEPVRRNIRLYSRGIFDLPSRHLPSHLQTDPDLEFSDLPLRSDCARLSRAYQVSIQNLFPILHWSAFSDEVDQIYLARSLEGTSREWIGLFFAVMACGTLQISTCLPGPMKGDSSGMIYFEKAAEALTPLPRDFSMMQAKTALLLSIYATESNMGSVGSIWAAVAVKIAQGLGLNFETEIWPVVDGEMRRRLWWSIYTWDRIISIQSNCPMLINEDDCDVPMPCSIEDRRIQSQGFVYPRMSQPPFTGYLAVIQVARLFSQLYQTLKSSTIAPQTLQLYDERFQAKSQLFPEAYQSISDAHLEPEALYPLLTLQMARFALSRRNLSPVCERTDRLDALRRCTSVGQDTSKYIARTLSTPSEKQELEKMWQTRVMQVASSTLCIHLWRCMLILCFGAEYKAALMCLDLSMAIGDVRKINAACGRNLGFFLERLIDRVRSGNGSHHQLEHDEEMLAYVSGDLQGRLEHSWAWAGSDVDALAITSPRTGQDAHGSDEPVQSTQLPRRPSTGSLEDGNKDWDGWVRVRQMMHTLMDEHDMMLAQPPSYYPPPHNPVKRVQLAPDTPGSPPSQSSSSRISIANII